MILPPNAHAQIMEYGGTSYRNQAVFTIATFVPFKTCFDFRLPQKTEHDQSVHGNGSHVYRPVIIETQPDNRNSIGIFLGSLYFIVLQKQFKRLYTPARKPESVNGFHQLTIQCNFS
jgi:hypothetical protein